MLLRGPAGGGPGVADRGADPAVRAARRHAHRLRGLRERGLDPHPGPSARTGPTALTRTH